MAIISVFGSSSPQQGGVDYELAHQMGRLLAQAGFTVQTGGYGGVMAAASHGASEAGGHVIGVTCTQIETIRPRPANQWVKEEIKYPTLKERLIHLVDLCDGAIVMPGGIGTLSELSLIWSLVQVHEISARPIITVGQLWIETLKTFIRPEYVKPDYAGLVELAKTPEEALNILRSFDLI